MKDMNNNSNNFKQILLMTILNGFKTLSSSICKSWNTLNSTDKNSHYNF